jgi:hypothetical protein
VREERHVYGVPTVKPRIESLWFGDGKYARMAKVFEATARRHCPGWDINVRKVDQIPIPAHRASVQGHIANTQKLEDWNQIVQDAPDGARIPLIDADTAIVNPIDDIWDLDFDIAYTTKRSTFPFNLGVIFVRVSAPARAFFAAWTAENRHMLQKKVVHREYRQRFGGINQASFGRTLETPAVRGVNLLGIPCVEWNCEDSSWERFDPERTRIVHVKSALRRAIFDGTAADLAKPGVARLAEMWKGIEADCMAPA